MQPSGKGFFNIIQGIILFGSKITADGDCSHEIKRRLLLGRKAMTNLNNILKSRDITLLTKVCIVKTMVFPVVMYGCESWLERKLSTKELMLFNCGVGEDAWESLGMQGDQTSQSQWKSILNIYEASWTTDAEAEAPILWPPAAKSWLIRKDPDAGKDWRQEEKRTTEDEIVGWHNQLNGHEFEQAPGDGDGRGSLACCSPWGCKESDTTEQLNNNSILSGHDHHPFVPSPNHHHPHADGG